MSEVSGETMDRVLAILVREADMDGLVTVTQTAVAAELGLSHTSAWYAIEQLAEHRKLSVLRRGHGAIPEIQLAESVFA